MYEKQVDVAFDEDFTKDVLRLVRDYRVGFRFVAPDVIKLLAADKRDRIYRKLLRKA